MQRLRDERWKLTAIAAVSWVSAWKTVSFTAGSWEILSNSEQASFIATGTVVLVIWTAAFTLLSMIGHVSAAKE